MKREREHDDVQIMTSIIYYLQGCLSCLWNLTFWQEKKGKRVFNSLCWAHSLWLIAFICFSTAPSSMSIHTNSNSGNRQFFCFFFYFSFYLHYVFVRFYLYLVLILEIYTILTPFGTFKNSNLVVTSLYSRSVLARVGTKLRASQPLQANSQSKAKLMTWRALLSFPTMLCM